MGKKKLKRFAENITFSHLFQYPYEELIKGFPLKGKWNEDYFHNNHPIILELGCGKGEYSIFLAKKYPDKNFIGIDIKGARLWRGSKTVEEENLKNVAFVRTKIQLITLFFGPGEISEIWITFPDPQPRKSKESKRLNSPAFLKRYNEILRKEGIIHLKTDNEAMFDYMLEIIEREGHRLIQAERDVYGGGYEGDANAIRTFYEEKFNRDGSTIKYVEFQLHYE